MKIIDTHLHFYNLSNNINGWIYKQINAPHLQKNCLPNSLTKQANHDLYGVVHIEAHDSNIATAIEIDWLQKLMTKIKNFDYRHIALADITLPIRKFHDVIRQIKQYPCVVGIRHTFSFHENVSYSPCKHDLSTHPNILSNLNYLADNGLIFDCQGYPYQINNLLPMIDKSGVDCILDHLVLPAWNKERDSMHKLWQTTIINLAKRNNIFIKISGLDMFKKADKYDDVLKFCLENFPLHRLIYASNYPVSFNGDYNFWHHYLTKYLVTSGLSIIEQEQIFFKTASHLFFRKVGDGE